ncbi:MAG TPA: hypothetical protein ENK85_01930 [Saprospiraceae bacterium]|nr:hypothetical protein [Saprospiraceae bacterium]
MSLKEFFDLLGQMPSLVLSFFLLVPLTALLAWLLGRGEGHLTPWKYLYSFLVFLICIPGVFAVTLDLYLFLFEKQSIMEANIYTQILPILSMGLTLMLIRQNVSFDDVPGFGKIGGLITLISIVLIFMWFVDRTRIYVFSYMPFQTVLLIFAGLLIAARWGTKRLFGGSSHQ